MVLRRRETEPICRFVVVGFYDIAILITDPQGRLAAPVSQERAPVQHRHGSRGVPVKQGDGACP